MELRQKLASPTVSNRKRKSETDEIDDATIVKQPKLEDEIQIKKLIETVADCMAFGALEHCPECGGFIVFNYTTYKCTGNITEWTKCMYSTQSPNRKPFEIPVDVKQQYNILPKYNPKFPLKGYSIVLAGRLSKTAATLQQEIERLGAKILANVDATGRTGTIYGGKKNEQFDDQSEAIKAFETLFLDKTGNKWSDRGTFKKFPNKFYPLEIDYGNHDIQKVFDNVNANKRSNLPKLVQDLICFIFDIESMEEALLSFEIDLTKMPLGRLSRNQLNKGYQVLTELQTLITNDATNKTAIIDASNRFYTLIPHNFNRGKPIILDKIDLIQSKTEIIDNLLEIEKAYSMLKETNDQKNEHSIDDYYKKLKCSLQPVDHNSEEFHRIEQYMTNTYAPHQRKYTLKLKELFKTTREGEREKFQKWQSTENRQLLWHGSRKTNFAGILSQGLRIAPPEAPASGYNFGKGVYFTDMVSKGGLAKTYSSN
ncbi:unnamed protein product [Rotaria sordida]|uniref:Poly [ADP-ribose] polymerase n=1 Tax=Rotaria sordida TaxID=392033 RepID=A0A819AMN2_9BILA|nr:unnamed protein product [Rotaria sordida]CAF3942449.1 unnamed protein product [Rotaria sordida]